MRLDLDFPVVTKQYRSDEHRPSWFSRTFPSLSFYSGMCDVVFSGAKLAKAGEYDDKQWCTSSFRILRYLERSGVNLTVDGVEHALGDEPYVFIGNHMSTLETFVMPYLISPNKPVTFIIKKSLVEYPVFKHIMISRNPVVVGRENPREDLRTMLNEGVNRLNSGISLIVFPQTTRTSKFDPSQFNSIGVKIAKKAGVKVIPVALKTNAWGNAKIKAIKDFGKISPERNVHFKFGKPMEVTGNGSEQQQATIDFIQSNLNAWNTGYSSSKVV